MKMKVTKSKSGSDMKSPIECAAWKAFLFKNRLPSEQGRALNGGIPCRRCGARLTMEKLSAVRVEIQGQPLLGQFLIPLCGRCAAIEEPFEIEA